MNDLIKIVTEQLKNQPLYLKVAWLAFTSVGFVYILILVAIAIINPFWFRKNFFSWVIRQPRKFSALRAKVFDKPFKKAKLFEIIKDPTVR